MRLKRHGLPAETEDGFLGWVLDLAKLHGWRVAHFRPALTARGWRTPVQADGAGFPDLVLVRGEQLIFAELKSERGRLSDEQRAWLDALGQTAATCCVWRPSDRQRIEELLSRSRGAAGRCQGLNEGSVIWRGTSSCL